MMKSIFALFSSLFMLSAAHAQFAPQAGVSGSTAIKYDSSIIVNWANACTVQRGYRDIAVPDSGYASLGADANGVGMANHTTVSLGDSGVATLTFQYPIFNGPGPDFAVFENGFSDPNDAEEAFLEFAFVEVSSDGVHYYRFQSASFIDTPQIPAAGVYSNARLVNNLAGKYVSNYGTPFNLDDLAGTAGLNVNRITHVRLVDVIGSLGAHACADTGGRAINDPYPTNFPSSGFDLDAVGVIHQMMITGVNELNAKANVAVYPNPVTDKLRLNVQEEGITYSLTDLTGRVLHQAAPAPGTIELSMSGYGAGMYYLILRDHNGNEWVEKITKH